MRSRIVVQIYDDDKPAESYQIPHIFKPYTALLAPHFTTEQVGDRIKNWLLEVEASRDFTTRENQIREKIAHLENQKIVLQKQLEKEINENRTR